eukprot:CFRG2779T1
MVGIKKPVETLISTESESSLNSVVANHNRKISTLLLDPKYTTYIALFVILCEIPLNIAIIHLRNYTEIDWIAYMQEVEGVANGEYDYSKLKGGTGPLVYPAGFVYVFGVLRALTSNGEDIRLAQYIFGGIYVCLIGTVLAIYTRAQRVPPVLLLIMSFTSYRIHSIFVLRLFNDPIAMVFAYASFMLLLLDKWNLGCFLYSLAVSIKMNVLLFAPGLLVLLWRKFGFWDTIRRILIFCALPQGVLALPFLTTYPVSYIKGAFNFGRVFAYEWTVNWRFLSEEIFLDKRLHLSLLALHLVLLALLAVTVWTRRHGGLWAVMTATPKLSNETKMSDGTNIDNNHTCTPSTHEILFLLFSSNYVGMCFSRSLHYQFYVWYYHTIPYLLWSTKLHIVARIAILMGFEYAWNTYPSTPLSSGILLCSHLMLLAGILTATIEESPMTASGDAKKQN